jgi:hypothetical protein
MERDIDCLKHRKATHLSGADVLEIIEKKGKCILKIKDAYYNSSENVAGKNTGGYFIKFDEDLKPAILNTINKKRLIQVAKTVKGLDLKDARNIKNWIGLSIELIFDSTVKFGAEITGGFRILPISPIPTISDVNGLSILNSSKTLLELQANWSKLTKEEQSIPTVVALKDKLKTELK